MALNNSKMFQMHPKIQYQGDQLRDLTRQARVLQIVRESDYYSSSYIVQEGETPVSLAQDFYNDPNLFWIILNLNNMINPWIDWPMSQFILTEFTKNKYDLTDATLGSTFMWGLEGLFFRESELSSAVRTFESFINDANGNEAVAILNFKQAAELLSYIEFETIVNEEKRNIRLVRPNQINVILKEYKKEISK